MTITPTARGLLDTSGRPTLVTFSLALVAVAALVVASAYVSLPLFAVATAILLVLVGYGAWRWPRGSLVGVVLATLADPVLIGGLLPSRIDPLLTGFSEVMVGTVGIVILVHGLRARRLIAAFTDPVTVFGGAFVAVAVVSAILNGVPVFVATLGIVATIDALATFYLARMLPFDRRSISLAVAALVTAATLAALLGIAQALLTPQILWFQAYAGRFGEGGRVTAFLGNPNMLAAFLGFVLPFPLFGTRHLPTRSQRWLAAAVLLILTLALILTFSRGAWVAVLLGVIIGTLVIDWRLLFVMTLVVVLAYFVTETTPRNLLVDPNDLPPYAQGSEDSPPDFFDSLGDRLGYIGALRDLRVRFILEGIPIAYDHPLLGVGPGRYGGAVARITNSSIYDQYGTSLYGYRTVHNFWLHTLGEVGALGLAIFLTMIIELFVRFARYARAHEGLDRLLLGAAATALMITIFNNTTEMIFEGNSPALLIWLYLGLFSLLAPAGLVFRRRSPATRPAPTDE